MDASKGPRKMNKFIRQGEAKKAKMASVVGDHISAKKKEDHQERKIGRSAKEARTAMYGSE